MSYLKKKKQDSVSTNSSDRESNSYSDKSDSSKESNESNESNDSSDESDVSIHEEIDEDHLENFEKYKQASKIVNVCMKKVLEMANENIKIVDLAIIGDTLMKEELEKVYKNKNKLQYGKGIAMPTCISINNIVSYYSPTNDDDTKISNGDLIKIEMGVHIDGFICLRAESKYISFENDPNKDKIENLLKAINECESSIKGLLKVDKKILDLQDVFEKVCKKYGTNLLIGNTDKYEHIAGHFCYQLSRGFFDSYNEDEDDPSHKMIVINKKIDVDSTEPLTSHGQSGNVFITNDVMVIDIMMSTGTGLVINRNSVKLPTVYIKTDEKYNLKRKASRYTLSEFKKRNDVDNYPVSIRDFDNSKIRFGIKECVDNGLLEPFVVLAEKDGEFIAQKKFTVIIKFNKNHYLNK